MLRKHRVKEHLGRSFECEKCEYKSFLKGTLKRHKGLKHGEGTLLQCSSCEYKTAARFILMAHEQAKHGNMTWKETYSQWNNEHVHLYRYICCVLL